MYLHIQDGTAEPMLMHVGIRCWQHSHHCPAKHPSLWLHHSSCQQCITAIQCEDIQLTDTDPVQPCQRSLTQRFSIYCCSWLAAASILHVQYQIEMTGGRLAAASILYVQYQFEVTVALGCDFVDRQLVDQWCES
jgi:hypothetical protein